MSSAETLQNLETAYFEDFSGVSRLLDVELPNRPDPNNGNPDYSDLAVSLGQQILDHNRRVFEENGLALDPSQIPTIVKDMLGLTDAETARIIGVSEDTLLSHSDQFLSPLLREGLKERFFVAKFLSDFLDRKIRDGELRDVLRKPARAYDGRTMIEYIGDGYGASIVGMTYHSLDVRATA